MDNAQVTYRDKGLVAYTTCLKAKSDNAKTGDMAQMAVLCDDVKPTDAIKTGQDNRNCGTCPLRGRVCYVNPVAINGQHRAASNMPVSTPVQSNKAVRLGSYGDPAFIPMSILRKVVRKVKWTGYTHQWEYRPRHYARLLMASVDNMMATRAGITPIELKRQANSKGYRTFRIIQDGDALDTDEIMCPHYATGVQCRKCGLCSGTDGIGQKNIVAIVHGPQNKVKTYQKEGK